MSPDMPLSSLSKPIEWMAKRSRALEHAREIADVSDRWFLSVTGGVAGVGGWARREAWIVADSAVAAFATTVNVAKKLAAAEPPRPPARQALPAEPLSPSPSPSLAPRAGETLDLLCAVYGEREEAEERNGDEALPPEGVRCTEPHARNPAGVVPLLQALGRTVAKHTPRYASLQEDPRFWTLIHLLQGLGEPAIVARPPGVEASEDLTPAEAP
jgi:hypothetical protein